MILHDKSSEFSIYINYIYYNILCSYPIRK